MSVISEKPISMAELKEQLEKIKARDKELNYRAVRTEEYLQNFALPKDGDALYKQIEALNIPRLKEMHIVKIMDIMPTTVEELKAILQAYTITVNNDNLKKIIETINKTMEK